MSNELFSREYHMVCTLKQIAQAKNFYWSPSTRAYAGFYGLFMK